MSFCPQCGIKTLENEKYCVSCGTELPHNIEEREKAERSFNKWWLVPISTLMFFMIVSIVLHFYLTHMDDKALHAYEEGVNYALNGEYEQAQEKFNETLKYRGNFSGAISSLEFLSLIEEINQNLDATNNLIENHSYQQALRLINESENKLSQYDGELVNRLLSRIHDKRNDILISQVEYQLSETPSLEELKMYLWRVESINTDKAQTLAETMREQIVNYSFNSANDELNSNQFSMALSIVNDGLKYVPNSERLESLKTTIEKQKVAFETEQHQRTQQALTLYELEQETNETNAIELINIDIEKDDKGVTVLGEVKSVATVPIYSVSIEYTLYDQEDELILENETFLYPETLYPEESGKFEYLHSNLDDDIESLDIHIEKISWYLEGQ